MQDRHPSEFPGKREEYNRTVHSLPSRDAPYDVRHHKEELYLLKIGSVKL